MCRRHCACFRALLHEVLNLLVVLDREQGKAVDVRARLGVVAHLEPSALVCLVAGVEEVAHLFIVDFHHGSFHAESHVRLVVDLYAPK